MSARIDLERGLSAQQHELEMAMRDAMLPLVHKMRSRAIYERECSLQDLFELSRGGDAMYDRPTIGVMYALWYQAKRTQDAVRALAPLLLERDDDVVVLDLGAGTGSTWWGCLAIERARLKMGRQARKLSICAAEASLPMLTTARELWSDPSRVAFSASVNVQVDAHLTSVSLMPGGHTNAIAYAGYLFDASDASRARVVGEALSRKLATIGATDLLVVSSAGKAAIVDESLEGMSALGGWNRVAVVPPQAVWQGPLNDLVPFRRAMANEIGGGLQALGSNAPNWSSSTSCFAHLKATIGIAGLASELELGLPVLALDDPQLEASRPEERLTAVIGAAGSGKSRVLVERLVQTLLFTPRGGERRVLVTTFNKLVIEQLAEWFESESGRLGTVVTHAHPGEGEWVFQAKGKGTVTFLNWDKIPTRLFGVPVTQKAQSLKVFEAELAKVSLDTARYLSTHPEFDASFLEAEHGLVVYGLGAITRDEYLTCVRTARASRPTPQGRLVLWDLMMGKRPQTFTDARIGALRSARSGDFPKQKFTHVFVDECQDFLRSDFELVSALVDDTQNLSVFGDEAQGLHVGASYRRPGTLGSRRWKVRELDGSYRLPIRVCEAVAPLATRLKEHRGVGRRLESTSDEDYGLALDDIVLPRAVKNAMLGVRPIVVAGTVAQIQEQVAQVIAEYADLLVPAEGRRAIATIAESDPVMLRALHKLESLKRLPAGLQIEPASMRRIKGLERPLVLWSTEIDLPNRETAPEWIYTILTRTTGVVVVALSENTPNYIRAILGRLDRHRLLFWSEQAERAFATWRGLLNGAEDPLA